MCITSLDLSGFLKNPPHPPAQPHSGKRCPHIVPRPLHSLSSPSNPVCFSASPVHCSSSCSGHRWLPCHSFWGSMSRPLLTDSPAALGSVVCSFPLLPSTPPPWGWRRLWVITHPHSCRSHTECTPSPNL